jgi:hypothetical protein
MSSDSKVNGEIQEMVLEGIEDSFQTETLPLPNISMSLWKTFREVS